MTDRDALLAAILAHPDDDTPRLVYADWLQEHGEDNRAEFIRVQCQIERINRRSKERTALAAREVELRYKLFGEIGALGFAHVTFRRGFISSVTAGLLNFRDNATKLTPADAPAYEWIYRKDDRDNIELEDAYEVEATETGEVFARPELRRCISLDLPCVGLDPSSYMFDSEELVNVRRLNFPNNEAGPNIESVASPTFANLRWANFNYSNSANGRPSITPFAECPHLTNLEYLDFGRNSQWNDDLLALAGSPHLPRLRYLSVSSSSFGPVCLDRFFSTNRLPALAELDLSRSFDSFGECQPRDATRYAEWLAASPLFARLSKLWLQGNGITDDGAKALASAPPAVKLERLDLSYNSISDDGQRRLRERFGQRVCVFKGKSRD